MNLSQLYFIGKAGSAGEVLDYFTANDAVYPQTVEASALGRNNHPLVIYPEDEQAYVDFPGVLPPSGIVKVRILWAATVVIGDVLWEIAWERDNATFFLPQVDLDIDSFAPSKTVVSAAPAVTGLLRESSLTFDTAEMGGLLPGEPYRIRVLRNAGVGPDTMVGDAQLFRVILGATP